MKLPRTLHGTVSLGDLIEALKCRDQEQEVYYDFGGFAPEGIGSYRGYYEHLALGFAEDADRIKPIAVAALVALLESANGKTFEGYKGGDFTMHAKTPVWVSNYGRCDGVGITGIYDRISTTYLRTKLVD